VPAVPPEESPAPASRNRYEVVVAAVGAVVLVGVVWLVSAVLGAAPRATAPATAVPAVVPTAATPEPSPTALPTRTPRPTLEPRQAAPAPPVPTEPPSPEQQALQAAQEQLQAVAETHLAKQLRTAKVARLPQRLAANGALRDQSSATQRGSQALNYATIRFDYGAYGDAASLVRGVSRNFYALAPDVFAIPEIDQFELIAYVSIREPSGKYDVVPGVLLAMARDTAATIDWQADPPDWAAVFKLHDPQRNALYVDQRVQASARR